MKTVALILVLGLVGMVLSAQAADTPELTKAVNEARMSVALHGMVEVAKDYVETQKGFLALEQAKFRYQVAKDMGKNFSQMRQQEWSDFDAMMKLGRIYDNK